MRVCVCGGGGGTGKQCRTLIRRCRRKAASDQGLHSLRDVRGFFFLKLTTNKTHLTPLTMEMSIAYANMNQILISWTTGDICSATDEVDITEILVFRLLTPEL